MSDGRDPRARRVPEGWRAWETLPTAKPSVPLGVSRPAVGAAVGRLRARRAADSRFHHREYSVCRPRRLSGQKAISRRPRLFGERQQTIGDTGLAARGRAGLAWGIALNDDDMVARGCKAWDQSAKGSPRSALTPPRLAWRHMPVRNPSCARPRSRAAHLVLVCRDRFPGRSRRSKSRGQSLRPPATAGT